MNNYTIVREQLMKQKNAALLFTGKVVNTIATEVVDKWVIMVKLDSGNIGVGIDTDKSNATELAVLEAKSL